MQHFNGTFDKLKDVEIQTPEKEDIIKEFASVDEKITSASSPKEAIEGVKCFFEKQDDLSTIISLVNFHHTINTADERYSSLQDLLDEILPLIEESINTVSQHIYSSNYRKELEAEFGTLYFRQIELSLKTFSKEIIPDLVEENKEVSEYIRLTSSAQIEFEGNVYSLSQMGKFTTSLDRETRIAASKKCMDFYKDNDEKIGAIYSSMVQTRTRIAKKLGYENFVQLGYDLFPMRFEDSKRIVWAIKKIQEVRITTFFIRLEIRRRREVRMI